MTDPGSLIVQLEDLTARLDTASRTIYTLQEELAPIEEQVDDLSNDFLTALLAEYEDDDNRRLPGEDVRNALVTKKIREQEPRLFGEHRRKTKELDRMERRAKRIERQINSKQSSLSYLKTEASATS